MAERLQIWNAALGDIGEARVLGDLNDPSTEANAIRRVYAAERNAMFAEFPWRFASRTATPASSPTTPIDAEYAYLLPTGCALVVALTNVADQAFFDLYCDRWGSDGGFYRTWGDYEAPVIPWKLGGITDDNGNDKTLILTSQPATYLRYVRVIEQEAVWPQYFAHAMEWRLAWKISFAICRDQGRRQEAFQQFSIWLDQARAQDQRQAYEPAREAEAIRARV